MTSLIQGLDGRVVRSVYPSSTQTWLYDASSPTAAQAGPSTYVADVTDVEFPGSTVSLSGNYSGGENLFGGSVGGTLMTTSTTLDSHGNVTSQTDFGRPGVDTPIVKAQQWIAVDGVWAWRVSSASVGYQSGAQRTYSYTYDSLGDRKTVSAVLSGTTTSLIRNESVPPVNMSLNGTVLLSSATYDPTYGNLLTKVGANGSGYESFLFDSTYQQLVIQHSRYPNGVSGNPLTESLQYDRGLEFVTQSTSPDGAVTNRTADTFGRVATVSLPSAATPGVSDSAIDFVITRPIIAGGPFQYATTVQTLDATGDTRELISYTDALGRPVLNATTSGLEDPAGSWICSGVASRDAKGNIVAAYPPYFATIDVPTGASIPLPTDVPRTFTWEGVGDG
jgi:hypothetical protein